MLPTLEKKPAPLEQMCIKESPVGHPTLIKTYTSRADLSSILGYRISQTNYHVSFPLTCCQHQLPKNKELI